jgi:hypothetical protein
LAKAANSKWNHQKEEMKQTMKKYKFYLQRHQVKQKELNKLGKSQLLMSLEYNIMLNIGAMVQVHNMI